MASDGRKAALVVTLSKGANPRPMWELKWRTSDGRQAKKRLGPAFLERIILEGDDSPFTAPPRGEGWRAHWTVPMNPSGTPKKAPRGSGLISHDDALAKRTEIITEWESDDEAKRAAAAIEAKGGPVTFGQVADDWLAERAADADDGHLKRSTLKDYTSMLRRSDRVLRSRGRTGVAWVMEAFDTTPIDQIEADDIKTFDRKLRTAKLSPRTRVKYLTVLSMVFDFAIGEKHVATNPVVLNRAAQPKRRRRAREKQLVVYSSHVVEEIAAEAEDQVGEIVRLAALTGLRQGELLALKWGDISFERRAITVSRTTADEIVNEGDDAPKSGRTRTVPLSDQAGAVLDRVSRREDWTGPRDLVFGWASGNSRPGRYFRPYIWLQLDDSTVRREYMRARDVVVARHAKDDDELHVLTFHGLRHCFGSACAAAGVPLSTVKTWMGHANIETTMVYIHFTPQDDDADRLTRAQASGTTAELIAAE